MLYMRVINLFYETIPETVGGFGDYCLLIGVEFEVLVVFHGAPGAAPDKAVFDEQAVAEVAFIDLVAELLAAVGIGLAVGGFYDPAAILLLSTRLVHIVHFYIGHFKHIVGYLYSVHNLFLDSRIGLVVFVVITRAGAHRCHCQAANKDSG